MHPRRPSTGRGGQRTISRSRVTSITTRLAATQEYMVVRVIGTGTFGAVFEVIDREGHHLALKKVLQDPNYKNRELSTLKRLNHPNCMKLIRHFFTHEGDPPKTYLHIVSELFPCDLLTYIRGRSLAMDTVRIFSYQIFSALAYLHSIGICHRDIKPTNMLIDPISGKLQLCDFGNAKPMQPGDIGVSYMATRSYRAPELLFDDRMYTFAIDVWAAGCVVAEMVRGGTPLFRADNNNAMIVEVAGVIGPATPENLREYGTSKVPSAPKSPPKGIEAAIGKEIGPDLRDLLERIFVYSPKARITAAECMRHPFLEPVGQGKAVWEDGKCFVAVT